MNAYPTEDGRLIGRLPKIGIRPVIDGRLHGARESLEPMTMGLAQAVAQFLTSNLCYPNGTAVQCVIADTSIGGVAEAARCADKFAREGVGVSISVTPCWCYGAETMDMDPLMPKAVWGFNGSERPGAVYLASVLAAHNQKGLPAFGIYGRDVQDAGNLEIPEDVREKLLRFAKAGLAAAMMRGKSYLALGGTSMGIAGSMVNPNFFENYLGMRVETVDMSEYTRRIDEHIYDEEEFVRALAWVKQNCKEGRDPNAQHNQQTRAQKDAAWETSVKMMLITRDMLNGNPRLEELGFGEESHGRNALAGGFQGQRQWCDHSPTGDFMEAILNSSFDWNGIRRPYVFATENDSLNGATMLLNHLLTNTAQIFADVRTFWSPQAMQRVTGQQPSGAAEQGLIHLINSGAASLDGAGRMERGGQPVMKPFWEISPEEVQRSLSATSWHAANHDYFRAGGWSSHFVTRGGMPVTMARLNLVQGLGPVLQIAEGETVELPEQMHNILDMRTDPTWPTTWFSPRLTGSGSFKDVYSVMNNWGANHGAISCGHIGADLITLASILRIPVNMHNVCDEQIFRPSAWTAYGTSDIESADYRACNTYGPLYR